MRKESDTGIFNCLICKEDKTSLAIGECEHRRVCLYCSMKSRLLYKDIKCPVCNTKQDFIFIVDNTDYISYSDLEKNKDMYYQDDEFTVSGIYYTTIEAKEEALHLRGFNCPIKRCRSEAFENLQSLKLHLEKTHKRYYCDCCLKEDKKFLSEMEIYPYDQLMDHTQYGEYENGILIYPPHPSCPFCDLSFYNDESLFKHMNGTHFICQLCKDQKNIIFYSILDNLLSHYKEKHFCCPFQECLEDIFVVFEKEEELISHMVTKHKVTNASERLTQLLLDSNKTITKGGHNKKWQSKGNSNYLIKDQFHFTQYINDIKYNSEKYLKDLEKQTKYVKNKDNEYNNDNSGYSGGGNGDGYYNEYNNRRGRGGNRGKQRGGQGQGQGQGYDNNNQYGNYSNKYDKHNKQKKNVFHQEVEVTSLSQTNNNNNNNNQQVEQEQQPKVTKSINPHKSSKPKDIDYSFVFNFFLKCIKEYIKNKILKDKTPEEQFKLPKETIYQLMIIIDKFESYHKMFELTALHTFGLDINMHKELKSLLALFSDEESYDYTDHIEKSLSDVLDKLSIKNSLILYKYIQISTKKVDGLFYKFDLEQIDSDLYEDFVQRPYDKTKKNEEDKGKEEANKADAFQPKSNLNYLFGKEKEKEKESSTSSNSTSTTSSYTKPKSKLYLLLSSTNQQKEVSGHKVNIGKQKDFKMANFDLDKDFPPLK